MTNLKEILFTRVKAELDGYKAMEHGSGYTEQEIEEQRQRFCAAYQIVEEAELEDEYQDWKATQE